MHFAVPSIGSFSMQFFLSEERELECLGERIGRICQLWWQHQFGGSMSGVVEVVGEQIQCNVLRQSGVFEFFFLGFFFFSLLVMRPLLLLGLPVVPWFLSLQGVCPAQPVCFAWR